MSYNRVSEQDLDLKLKYMRFLWNLGYFTRKNIELTRFDTYGKDIYTDIDVFGIKFDDELNYYIVIGDCKSGKNVKNAERLFWLYGVMKAVNANRGLFLRTNIDEIKFYELAEKLTIDLLTLDQLTEFEEIYNITNSEYFGPFKETHDVIEPHIKKLKRINGNIFNYISTKYWFAIPSEQIVTLMSCCNLIRSYPIDEQTKSFLLSYIYALLAVSLLKFSRKVLFIPDSKRRDFIEQNLLGGVDEYIQRVNLLSSFHSFMVTEIMSRYNERYPVSEEQFVKGLTPQYINYVTDIVLRICDKPAAAKYLPQLIDIFTYEYLIIKEVKDINIALDLKHHNDIINILTNYTAFAIRANIVTDGLKDDLKRYTMVVDKKLKKI